MKIEMLTNCYYTKVLMSLKESSTIMKKCQTSFQKSSEVLKGVVEICDQVYKRVRKSRQHVWKS